jgi:hypothetical protein
MGYMFCVYKKYGRMAPINAKGITLMFYPGSQSFAWIPAKSMLE